MGREYHFLFFLVESSSPFPPPSSQHAPRQNSPRAAPSLYVIQVSNGSVSKILTRYYKVGVVQPKTRRGSRPRIATPQLVAGIAQLKREQPTLFAWEIREKLEAAGICTASGIPSVSYGGCCVVNSGALCVCACMCVHPLAHLRARAGTCSHACMLGKERGLNPAAFCSPRKSVSPSLTDHRDHPPLPPSMHC